MRVAIIGAGGIGGMLAVRLTLAGNAVSVLARGGHLAAIRKKGLTLRLPSETLIAHPAVATDHGEELPPGDLVIVAVKAQDLTTAMEEMDHAMSGGGLALPFLNGVEATDLLARRFGEDRVLMGIARISSIILEPGVIAQVTPFARFTIGTAEGRQNDPRITQIRRVFAEAGIDAPECPDVRVDLWRKFALLAAFSGTTAAARADAGAIARTPELAALFLGLAREVTVLGQAMGVDLPDTLPEEVLDFTLGVPAEMRASLAHDLDAGKPLEVDWLSGAVPRLGAAHGLRAPANEAIAAVLAPWRHGSEG